ncbi:MAG: hypothetical protein KIS88_01820 [Anaerolineales bacterium]|nr:hypothetical protein [Anaerolineales bacterium]
MARVSSASLNRRQLLGLGLLAAAAVAGYVLLSPLRGFPLDDAWIHQTYARNLALRGEWAFLPGQPSGGATSFFWVLLLTPGVWLGLAPLLWAWLLGWLTLWGLGALGAAAFVRLQPKLPHAAVWVGAWLLLAHHMVWAAVSGMETALFAMLCLAALWLSLRPVPHAFVAGLLAGAAMLVRPEGLTLLAPLGVAVWLGSPRKPAALGQLLAGFVLLLAPYLLFNQATSGSLWPSTFYAKQAEYAELLAQPLVQRWGAQLAQPLIGAGLFALPGFFYMVYAALRARDWRRMAWVAWLLGFALLFALRLPVTYQHGRYAMPLIPIFLVLSAAGWAALLNRIANAKTRRSFTTACIGMLATGTLAFYWLGGGAYVRDVQFIESEMVATAHWVQENTPADAVLAVHDIGALGYFAPRPLVDLAGLVSPEVVPFIRDEARLATHLDQRGVHYLIVFPDWYPQLSARGELLFTAPLGGMQVYRWVGGAPQQ